MTSAVRRMLFASLLPSVLMSGGCDRFTRITDDLGPRKPQVSTFSTEDLRLTEGGRLSACVDLVQKQTYGPGPRDIGSLDASVSVLISGGSVVFELFGDRGQGPEVFKRHELGDFDGTLLLRGPTFDQSLHDVGVRICPSSEASESTDQKLIAQVREVTLIYID